MDDMKDTKIDLESLVPKITKTHHTKTYPRIDPTKSTFSGAGKTVLVTAGATGIGYEISKAFAQTGVSRIIIVSRRAEPQQKAKAALEAEFPSTTVQGVQASVTDYPKITQVLQDAGTIDVLVICHAVGHNFAIPSKDLPLQELQDSFDTNTVAPFHLTQQYLHLPVPASGTKTLIHVGSAAAHVVIPSQIGYGPSKTAFSRMLGSYLASESSVEKDGVRMFSYHPGAFYTDAAAAT